MNRFPRLPLLLYSYLTAEILAPFFASFVILNAVFFLVKLIPFLNVVLDLSIGLTDFIRLFSYIFPNMFLYSIPMSAMMGMIIAFSRLTVDREILALKANGISVYTILPPVLLVSLLIAGITGYFSVRLIPTGEIAMKQLMFQLAKEKIDKGIKENAFTEALGDVVVYVQSIDQATGAWGNVWVSDMRGQALPTITMAQSGSMVGDTRQMQVTIVLENGSLNRPDGAYAQTVSFDRYKINIPLHIPSVIDGEDIARQSMGSMTMEQLEQAAQQWGRSSDQGRDALVHYHKRLALPVGCFILSLLGLPLGLRARVGRSAIGIPLGLGFFILYYILYTLGKNSVQDSSIPVALAMWLPNLVFLVLTLILVRQSANERPLLPRPLTSAAAAWNAEYFLPLAARVGARLRDLSTLTKKRLRDRFTATEAPRHQEVEKLHGPGQLSAGTIHGDAHSMECHIPGCASYTCVHCTIEFKNLEIAEQAGFTPCHACRAILLKRGASLEKDGNPSPSEENREQ
jgi:lipopolysaccharide export system permease protein